MDLPTSSRSNIVVVLATVLLILLSSLSSPNSKTSAHAAAAAAVEANIPNSSTDLQALLSFKSLLFDRQHALAFWNNDSLHYCRWRGVTCGTARSNPGRVVALDLESFGLDGTISPYIGNLTFLARIHLPNNSLQGHVPRELGNLSRLQYLNLSTNYLDGTIPDDLSRCSRLQTLSFHLNYLQGQIPAALSRCLNLRSLSLDMNFLTGGIPEDLASLPKLSYLNLYSNKLTGSIPALLGSNSELTEVYLSWNDFTGEIPASLGKSSTSLTDLVLNGNQLSGEIPASLWNISSLRYVDLSYNNLSGPIPPFPTTLSNLYLFSVSGNSLSGVIPSSLGNQSALNYLSLAQNLLEGSIPESIAGLPHLSKLDLSINSLSGETPVSLFNITQLTYLNLEDNNLRGNLPLDIGHTLPSIQTLVMQSNQFDGPIPTSLLNATGLEELLLESNSFSGWIPSDLGSLKNLRRLELGWNQLQARDSNFFSSLSSCRQLERLVLYDNKIVGTLPASIGNLSTSLRYLFVGKNEFHGPIPAEIGNLFNLSALLMDQANFTGPIPETIGELRNLNILDLSSNLLSGRIPDSIGNLTPLNELYMQDNLLSSSIPATLGNLRQLNKLNLSVNALSGAIPEELAGLSSLSQALDLSHNFLSGSLQLGSLSNLLVLNVSDNQLSGQIPSALGDCVVLESLRMEGNHFAGKIPESFDKFKSIQELDLSRNNLSGQIPEFLENLTSLRHLNLSFNELEGEVPTGGPFRNASQVSLVGNKRLCSGNPILQLPPCNSKSSAKPISHKLKILIPVAPIVVILILILTGAICYRRRMAGATISGLEDEQKLVSYLDISRATNGFSNENLVGTGSFGSVYRAKIDHLYEDVVVVKVFNLEQTGGLKSFIAECEALRNIRHRNLVKIITACSSVDSTDNDFKALVFEYMPNGSLEEWLHPNSDANLDTKSLNLNRRLNIAVDVASAMCYLHQGCDVPLVHCDLKPSNILLDNDMVAHVGDFGLARFLTTRSKNSSSLMGMKGSIGYIAPEYAMGSEISTQGDVYSYGVLLLELLTGKRPTDGMFKDGLNLHTYVESALHDERPWEILDPALFQDDGENINPARVANASAKKERCIASLVSLGLLCSKELPKERPIMEDVAAQLQGIKEMYSKVKNGAKVGETTTTISIMS